MIQVSLVILSQTNYSTPKFPSLKDIDKAEGEKESFNFKKYALTGGLYFAREMLTSDSPIAFYVYGGIERTWIKNECIYIAVEPRFKIGYLRGSTDKYDGDLLLNPNATTRISYNTFGWGGSGVSRLGYIFTDGGTTLYLEGEVGIMNFSTKASVVEDGRPTRNPSQNSNANLYVAGRVGLMGNISSSRMAMWVGVANLNSSTLLDKMKINHPLILDRRFDGELGISIFF